MSSDSENVDVKEESAGGSTRHAVNQSSAADERSGGESLIDHSAVRPVVSTTPAVLGFSGFSPTKPSVLDLSIDGGEIFKLWKRRWESFFRLSGLARQSKQTQFDVLISCLSDDTLKIVDNLPLERTQQSDVRIILQHLETYTKGQLNETVEHQSLLSRSQQDGERFDDFVTDLRELSKTCSFCEPCTRIVLKDCVVRGVRSSSLRKRLLGEDRLTLDKAITMCQSAEMADLHQREMEGQQAGVRRLPNSHSSQSQQLCGYCGRSQHPRAACPARNAKCAKCNRTGHFAKVCRSTATAAKQSGGKTKSGSSGPRKQLSLLVAATRTSHAPTVRVHIETSTGSATVSAIPDTGADVCAASPEFLPLVKASVDNLVPAIDAPQSADGSTLRCLGRLPVTLSIGEKSVVTDVQIIENLQGILLSWEASRDLALIPHNFPTQICRHASTPLPTREQLMEEFPTVFDGVLRVMPGEQFTIRLRDDAKPCCVLTPRRVPLAYRDPLEHQLRLLQEQGIIEPVTTPTEWCSPIVVVPKKDSDDVRLCVDFTQLNKYVMREAYQSPTPQECVADISAADASVFATFDALKGYHQCPLDPASRALTTFITPFGRYQFRRAPFGISSISEHYNRRIAEALDGLEGFRRIVDDVLVFDATISEHATHVRQFLQRCSDRGISLNAKKFKFGEQRIKFGGFELSSDGYSIDPSLVEAISCFPTPNNRTDLRSFMGLVNQLGSFTPAIASHVEPLRPLLSAKNEFVWSPSHQSAFEDARTALSTAPTLAYFDASKPISLSTDASRLHGLGFVLRQKIDDEWRVVQAGSRFLTDTESRYATIELEMLAVAWAVKKCHLFLAGQPQFSVVTDHKPLLPILNSKRLDEIENTRLQRLRRRLMEYSFVASWCEGKKHAAADALSRSPVLSPSSTDELAEDDSTVTVRQLVSSSLDAEKLSLRISAVQQATEKDVELQSLLTFVRDGFPSSKAELPVSLHPYWSVRDALSMDQGLVLLGCRLVIPVALRKNVLKQLHSSHQGIERTKGRARQTVYWPSISNDIANAVRSCADCQRELPSQPKEPLQPHAEPSRPFEVLSVDLGSHANKQFLIAVDHFSNWPWVFQLGGTAVTHQILSSFNDIFCTSGAPDIVYTDGGPQFTSTACQEFFRRWGIRHVVSSPHFPQSNGRAEAAVKSMKKIIRRTWDYRRQRIDMDAWTTAIIQYRNTPSASGLSPAQRLFGRPLQDVIPAHRRSFAPEWQKQADEAEQRATKIKQRVEDHFNANAQPLPSLAVGTHVALQDPTSRLWDRYGVVVEAAPHRRYFVRLPSGRVLVRNRRYLRRRYAIASAATGGGEEEDDAAVVAQKALESSGEEVPPSAVPSSASSSNPPRRSGRKRKRRQRLIEKDDI